MTAGRRKREYGLFLSPCYRPKLALDHTFSLLLTSKWATWVSGSAKILRDYRHEKTYLQVSIKKSSPITQKKMKSQLFYYLKSIWDMLCSLKQCKNLAKWQTLCCETRKSLTHTCRTLHQAWWQPQEHRSLTESFSLTGQHCILGAMQQEISKKTKQAKALIHPDISIYWRQGHTKPMTKNWRQWKATVLSPHIVCVLAKKLSLNTPNRQQPTVN